MMNLNMDTIMCSSLQKAIEKTACVASQYKNGLNAIRRNERHKFIVPDTRKIGGSLDIDSSVRTMYPEDNRWDYAIEYDNEVFFIEIHPAITSEVATVLAKLEWLKKWLNEHAPAIKALKPTQKQAYYWVYTNKYAIAPTSNYLKQLATKKIVPIKNWNYSLL